LGGLKSWAEEYGGGEGTQVMSCCMKSGVGDVKLVFRSGGPEVYAV
jgi:hypothetical protein